jgi:hypothetical protein
MNAAVFAIVAVVAMLLGFLAFLSLPCKDLVPAEVVMAIEWPRQVIYVTPPSLPDRNPKR